MVFRAWAHKRAPLNWYPGLVAPVSSIVRLLILNSIWLERAELLITKRYT